MGTQLTSSTELIPYPVRRDGIERIVRFANTDLADPDQVSCLRNWGIETDTEFKIYPNWPVPPRRLDHKVVRDQKRLVEVLDEIATHGSCTAAVDQHLDRVLRRMTEKTVIHTVKGVYVLFSADNIEQWYCFGIAALKGAQMDDLIRRCKFSDCRRFFVAWLGKRGRAGKRKLYCCPEHRNIDKQRRKRKRDRRERAARGIAI